MSAARRLAALRGRASSALRGGSAEASPLPTVAAPPLLDEQTLARLRRLSLHAGRARTEGLAGEHRSRRRGSSPEFADFKPYSQGDDFRRIDWNTYARLGGLFVRLSEVTTELPVHILLDSSASMDWGSDPEGRTKFTAARRLAAALACVALWSFDRLTIVPFADSIGPPFGPVQGRTQVTRALHYLQHLEPLGGTALAPVISTYARARARPGLLLLISDLLSGEPEDLRLALHELRGRGWQAAVVHIVDDAEIDPTAIMSWLRHDPSGASSPSLELIDRETGDLLRLTVEQDVVDRYASAVTAWLEDLEQAAAAEGTAYARLPAAWDLSDRTIALLYDQGVLA
ncbi:MAG: DUF58 domain-containing protein [Thermomicrobiales bacterium]|nr:DUF58 domain-containing protein [Thermomicrobiales bacterium]